MEELINVALFGAGRMGARHARHLVRMPGIYFSAICETQSSRAEKLASQHGVRVRSADEIMSDPAIDAVIIASATPTHVAFVKQAVKADKHIFCEKPLALSIAEIDICIDLASQSQCVFQMGFHRRFDARFMQLKQQLDAGAIGNIEMIKITSRDPFLPSMEYIRDSGTLFRDMMIHDFDMAMWLVGEDAQCLSLNAAASCLVDARVQDYDDYDTATCTINTVHGKLILIDNSRRSGYGYDQRIEVLGSCGLLAVDNVRESTLTLNQQPARLLENFPERYEHAYYQEKIAFFDAIRSQTASLVPIEVARTNLVLANAALESVRRSRSVKLEQYVRNSTYMV